MFRKILAILVCYGFVSCSNETTEQVGTPVLEVIHPKVESVNLYQEFVGQIYGKVDIPIRARVTGFLEGIHFEEGRTVTKDQLLYTVDPQPYQADVAAQKSKLAEAKTELVRASNELVRYEGLIKTKAVSQSDYEATKAQAEAAQANVEAAQANVRMAEINLGYCKIYSPIDGVIGKTEAKVGEFVGKDPNPVILNTVSHVTRVRVIFHLTEKQYLKLARTIEVLTNDAELDSVEDNLQLILADGSIHKYPGHVDFINREVDATTGSILVQASFPNPNRILRPGQFAKVRVLFDVVDDAVLVPQQCITELQGRYLMQIVNDSNKLQIVPVELGDKVGDRILVTAGISAKTKIVLSATRLPSGTSVNDTLVQFESRTANLK
jgi:membrane fusion protein (multidrug efflux system)